MAWNRQAIAQTMAWGARNLFFHTGLAAPARPKRVALGRRISLLLSSYVDEYWWFESVDPVKQPDDDRITYIARNIMDIAGIKNESGTFIRSVLFLFLGLVGELHARTARVVYGIVYRIVHERVYRIVHEIVYRIVYEIVYRIVYEIVYRIHRFEFSMKYSY